MTKNMIPVYGLSGIEINGMRGTNGSSATFEAYTRRISDPTRRAAVLREHADMMQRIEGIFDLSTQKINDGSAQAADYANQRKAKVLIILNNTDYDGFRLASRLMPYVVDVDEKDGGFYFATPEQAQVAAQAEDEYINILRRPDAEAVLEGGWFRKFTKAISQPFVSAAQSIANGAKATANTFKAAGQLVTGNTSGAKESIKKAGNQFKNSVVDPVVDITKANYDLTKETVKIGGKVFKVLFIKINPVTVMIRNGLRALLRLNIAGMATRLNVGLMTQEEAAARGYDAATWQKAVKAVERTKKLFKHMGGNVSKLEQSIQKGAKNPPLENGTLTSKTVVNVPDNDTDDGDATLGGVVTVAATIATCLGILLQMWAWIKEIVAVSKAKKEAQRIDEQNKANAEAAAKELQELQKKYAFDSNGNFYMDANGNYITWEQYWADQQAAASSTDDTDNTKKYMIAAAAGGLLLLFAAMATKKH